MKHFSIVLLLFLSVFESFGQGVPQYACDTTGPGIDTVAGIVQPFAVGSNLAQFIYHQSDFPGMPPQGFIADIFMYMDFTTPAGKSIDGLTVKMGKTLLDEYPSSFTSAQFRSLDSALTTVYYDSFFVLPASLPGGTWWRLHLPQPYQYNMQALPNDQHQNLVVQLSKATQTPTWTWNFRLTAIYYDLPGPLRGVVGSKTTSPYVLYPGTYQPHLAVIGFNGYPLSVDDPEAAHRLSVFPNPTTDKLYISGGKEEAYSIYDLTGMVVAVGKLANGGSIDVHALAAGAYLLRCGARTARFVKQ